MWPKCFGTLALSLACITGPAWSAPTSDLATLQTRLQSLACDGGGGNAARWLNTQLGDGSWIDVRYEDRSIANWEPSNHLQRLADVAAAHACLSGWRKPLSSDVSKALNQGLAYWFKVKPQSGNWWHNTVGAPTWMNKILVLARDQLSPDMVRQALTIYPDFDKIPADRMTGQNLVWYAREMLVMGLVAQDAARIDKAVRLILGTIKVTQAEGIQADMSFHQHGPQLYTAGYGLQLFRDASELAWALKGTSWAFPAADVDVLMRYGLGGIVPFFRPGWVDWGACGREFTRANAVRDKTNGLLAALQRAKELSPAHGADIERVLKGLGGDGRAPVWTGTRYYWRSETLVRQSPQWYVSVKASSSSTVATESGNGENLKGFWMGFGNTFYLTRGDEYNDILGGFDWQALPGVTSLNRVPDFTGYQRNEGGPTLGLVQGDVALMTAQVNKLGLRAQKSWLLVGDVLYSAGTWSSPEPSTTWVNQVSVRGDVRTGNDSEIWHDGLAYVPLPGYKLAHAVQTNGQRNAVVNKDLGPALVPKNVLKIWADASPLDGRYAYLVTPAKKMGLGAQALQQGPRLLMNEPDATAFAWTDATGTHLAAFVLRRVELTWAGAKWGLHQPGLYMLNKVGAKLELLFSAQATPKGTVLSGPASSVKAEGMLPVTETPNVWRATF